MQSMGHQREQEELFAGKRSPDPLAGKRVLLVEDEALVALMLEEMLEELGCVLAGTAASLPRG
jgi:hypothetical protein